MGDNVTIAKEELRKACIDIERSITTIDKLRTDLVETKNRLMRQRVLIENNALWGSEAEDSIN